jgi:hypothetical protein
MMKMPVFLFTMLTIAFFTIGCETSEEKNESENANTDVQAPDRREHYKDMLIQPGIGVGRVRLGMTVEEMENCLGKPDIDATGISFVYADLGIEVVIRDEKVNQIHCIHHINNAPAVKACKYQTVEGIGIGSTESEIISAYGEPSKRSKGALTYNELGMRFELDGGQVNLILVLKPW